MKKMNASDASRIQSTAAKKNGGIIAKGSFAARAQKAAALNTPTAKPATSPGLPSKKHGKASGKNRDNNPPKPAPTK